MICLILLILFININQRISSPLERRNVNLGNSLQNMSSLPDVTQSQYLRIEKDKILKEIEKEFSK